MRKYAYGAEINGYKLMRRGFAHDDSYIFECPCGGEFQSTVLAVKKRKLPGCHRCATNFKREDLRGNTYNELTVVDFCKNVGGRAAFLCKCSCGNTREVKARDLKSGRTKSCGNLWHRRGKNSPLYKGGRKPRDHQEGYIAWRGAVFARDNFTCRACSNRGGTLNAHHIVPHNACEELRTDVNNGITLCAVCHANFHKENGYSDPSLVSLLEFLYWQASPDSIWTFEDLVTEPLHSQALIQTTFAALHAQKYIL